MILHAESGAVVAWLLGEPAGEDIRTTPASAELIAGSDLIPIECDRVLVRDSLLGEIPETETADRRAQFNRAASHWYLLRLDSAIVARARRPFPDEPVRTPDAIHLASALMRGRSFRAP